MLERKPGKGKLLEKGARLRALGPLAPRFVYGFDWRPVRSGQRYYSLPFTRSWPVILIVGAMFAVFCLPYFTVLSLGEFSRDGGLFDLVFLLFNLFWFLGWSVGTVALLLVFLAVSFGRDTLRIAPGAVTVRSDVLGLGFGVEFQAVGIQDLRRANGSKDEGTQWRGSFLSFDYAGENVVVGSMLSEELAYQLINEIREIAQSGLREEDYASFRRGWADGVRQYKRDKEQEARDAAIAATDLARMKTVSNDPAMRWNSPSSLALIIANLIPLFGVLFLGWSIGEIMLIFWAESAVIGFYNLLKMWVIGRWSVLFMGPFFIGHFGAFMAGHLLFIYGLFFSGIADADTSTAQVLQDFISLWPALLAIFISHGISFRWNFIGRQEFKDRQLGDQMSEPYKRIAIMHLTIIFGGFLVMAFNSAVPALMLLILLKVVMDVRAHLREHGVNLDGRRQKHEATV